MHLISLSHMIWHLWVCILGDSILPASTMQSHKCHLIFPMKNGVSPYCYGVMQFHPFPCLSMRVKSSGKRHCWSRLKTKPNVCHKENHSNLVSLGVYFPETFAVFTENNKYLCKHLFTVKNKYLNKYQALKVGAPTKASADGYKKGLS